MIINVSDSKSALAILLGNVYISSLPFLFLGNLEEELNWYFKVSVWVNHEQERIGMRERQRDREATRNVSWEPDKSFPSHAIWCVLALVIQIAVLPNKFSFPQIVQPK